MTRHVMEALGLSRIVIEDGKVTEIGEPKVRYCPLFNKYRGIEEFNESTIRENIEYRIEKFGMCTNERNVKMKDFLSFGISELLSMAVKNKILNAAVIAADGTGTCVIDDPEIIQGLGGRISGIIETEPIPSVVEAVGAERLLDPERATIDQFAGVAKAYSMRYSKVGVTVAKAEDAAAIRDAFGDTAIIFAVHTTGTSKKDAETMFEFCDVITACASKNIRDVAKTKDVIQAGTKVPVYGVTDVGKRLILEKLKELNKKPSEYEEEQPEPLI